MRRILSAVSPLFVVLAGVAISVAAGADARVKVDLFEADIDPVTGRAVPVDPPVVAGFVIFTPTGSGRMEITIRLDTDEADAAGKTFDVRVVPSGPWGAANQEYRLTSNRQGQGTLHIRPDLPELYGESARIKVRLSHGDTNIAYTTELRTVPSE